MLRLAACGAAAAALAAGFAVSQDASESLSLSGFDGVKVSAGQSVEFTQSDTYSVEVEMRRGDIDDMKIEVSNGWLVVRPKSNIGWGRGPRALVRVTGPSLTGVEVSSGAQFDGDNITTTDISVDTSSGASASLEGSCDTLSVDVSSGSSVSARNLECTRVEADSSSGASITAFATDSVAADASSGSSVTVYGGATEVSRDRSSGASITIRS